MNFNFPIILASNSPRRRELMEGLGLDFKVKGADTDEIYPKQLSVYQVPEYLAELKAASVAQTEKKALVIGADTIVILENKILGKPEDLQQARTFLHQLSGQKHKVVTGVCIIYGKKKTQFKDSTEVSFATLTDEEIDHYLGKDRPLDKAGAYGIQEWIGMIGVEEIQGSYFNVVGLPVQKLYQALKSFQN